MKRLDREGHVITVRRPKDEPYLYMPNPAIIHTESSKIRHFLAIADTYIQIGQPDIFEVEPNIDPDYRPDVYTILQEPIVIEVQRSYINNKRMQAKVNGFVDTYKRGKHDAHVLWIVSSLKFHVHCPSGFRIEYVLPQAT
jgi:hypothetical protein